MEDPEGLTNNDNSSEGSAAGYGVGQVIAKGLPMPQTAGGKRSKAKTIRNRRRMRMGGFIQKAVVPIGLLALQKRTQRQHSAKKIGGKSKKSKKYKKSKKSKKSRKIKRSKGSKR